MSKPAILCVANWDSNVGYAWWLMESFWIEIANQFGNTHKVILAYPSISIVPEAVAQSNIEVIEFNFNFDNNTRTQSQVEFIKKHNVEHIYFSDRPVFHSRYFHFKKAGVKTITVHDHSPGERCVPKGINRILKSIKSRIPLFNADGAIGATEYVRQRLHTINCLPAKHCYAAPNGIPVTCEIDPSVNIFFLFDIPEDKKVLVTVGRANAYKGADFAIDVIKELKDSGRLMNLHYLYLGDGPHIEKFKQQVEDYGLSQHITFPGRVSAIGSMLPQCWAAFHPSKGEVGYSLSILEYMRAGLPCVTPDNPSVCEATSHGETGYIYPQGNLHAAADAIANLLTSDDTVAAFGQNAQNTVGSTYSLSRCHKSLINALQKITGLPTNGK